jgi:hypothetical protein
MELTICSRSAVTSSREWFYLFQPAAGSVPAIPQGQTMGGAACGCPAAPDAGPAANLTRLAGEPVNTATGAFVTSATDLRMGGSGFTFSADPTCNSDDHSAGPFGPGWSSLLNVSVPAAALAAAALLGCGAHLVNAAPDLADDTAAGIRGLPHALGRSRSVSVTVVLLLAATVIESFGAGHPGWKAAGAVTAVALTITTGIVLARRPGSRWLFRAALLVAAIDVAELLANGSHL